MRQIAVATWNVNSIRARLPVVQRYISENKVDILLLQETKCIDSDFPLSVFSEHGYEVCLYGQKAYNGVAILSRLPIRDVKHIDFSSCKGEARYIECIVESQDGSESASDNPNKEIVVSTSIAHPTVTKRSLRIGSIYVPHGTAVGAPRFYDKLQFLDDFYKHSEQIVRNGELYLVGGDYNVAPYDCDVANFDDFDGGLGFHPQEREKMLTILNSGLMIDLYRKFSPNDLSFSWWDYRDRTSYARNYGMRIDALLASHNLLQYVESVAINHNARGWHKPSDHCPVRCVLKL